MRQALDEEAASAIREVARNFARQRLVPLERSVMEREAARGLGGEPLVTPEETGPLDDEIRQLGLWGLEVGEELGGNALGFEAKAIALEELNYSIVPYRLPPESPNIFYLNSCATDAQRERYLLPLCSGEMTSALALTEPDAGSDAAGIRTSAVRTRDGWTITGTKQWISWADTVDFFIVIAVTDPELRNRGGMTAFIIPSDSPGLTVSDAIPTMGEQRPFSVYLDHVTVMDDAVLGEVGEAFVHLTNRLGVRRTEIGARCVGQAERLIDMMCTYSRERSTFGALLETRQAVQFMIADSVMEMESVRLLVYEAARRLDRGDRDIRSLASTVKVQASEMITRVADRAMQVYGAMGFSRELPIEFIYRTSRALRILEGPSEIHRTQVARLAIKERG